MLRDLQALQAMLQADMFETAVRRIGAEQEMFLVDASWQPAPGALAMLAALTGQPYTTEVGAFNLELNLDPQVFSGDCFARMHTQLDRLLALGHAAAEAAGLHIVLTGTLPTIRKRDLSLDNMVPNPRYLALNDALRGLRGSPSRLDLSESAVDPGYLVEFGYIEDHSPYARAQHRIDALEGRLSRIERGVPVRLSRRLRPDVATARRR